MGSPEFSLPTLRKLEAHFTVVGVVTQPDRPAGRGRKLTQPPVKEYAVTSGLQVIQPDKLKSDQDAFQRLADWQPDVIVVAAFGQILEQNILDLTPFGCLNIHPSLLPRWRGAAPVAATILHGDQVTGVTIMKMDVGVDDGPILAQCEEPVLPGNTTGSLEERLAVLGADLLVETIPRYINGDIKPQPQDDKIATYAARINKTDGELDFNLPAKILDRQVRAYCPWPGAYTTLWQGGLFKIHRAHVSDKPGAVPYQRSIIEKLPVIGSGDGWLVLDLVQPAGKKMMSGDVFLRGARQWEES